MAADQNQWDPSKPLPDAEDEKEANVRAQRQRRVQWLQDNVYKDPEPEGKKKKKSSWD